MQPVDFRFLRRRVRTQPVDVRTPDVEDIVVKLRRLGRQFGLLSGFGIGPHARDVVATCNAAADEVERLRGESANWAERLAEVPASMEAMTMARLGQGEEPIPTDELSARA